MIKKAWEGFIKVDDECIFGATCIGLGISFLEGFEITYPYFSNQISSFLPSNDIIHFVTLQTIQHCCFGLEIALPNAQ
jgi:hypothetical protein